MITPPIFLAYAKASFLYLKESHCTPSMSTAYKNLCFNSVRNFAPSSVAMALSMAVMIDAKPPFVVCIIFIWFKFSHAKACKYLFSPLVSIALSNARSVQGVAYLLTNRVRVCVGVKGFARCRSLKFSAYGFCYVIVTIDPNTT